MKLLKENEVKSPYDLREFLWYIIPGATFLLLIFLFEYWFAIKIRGTENFTYTDSTTVKEKILQDSISSLVRFNNQLNFNNAIGITSQKNPFDSNIYAKPSYPLTTEVLNDIARKDQRDLDSIQTLKDLQTYLWNDLHTPIFSALTITHVPIFKTKVGEKLLSENWIVAAIYLLLLLTICYIVGHVMYILGTYIFERGLVSKAYLFPSLKLLKLFDRTHPDTEPNPYEKYANQGFYKGLYSWLPTVIAFLYLLFLFKGHEEVNKIWYKWVVIGTFIFFVVLPIRLKIILYHLINWDRNRKKQSRPKASGYFYWFFVGVSIWGILSIFNPEADPMVRFWHVLIMIGILVFAVENALKETMEKNERMARYFAKELEEAEEFRDIPESVLKQAKFNFSTKHDVKKVIIEYLFTKWYNRIGDLLDKFSLIYFHTQEAFDKDFIEQIEIAFTKVYKLDYKKFPSHNYWLAKFYVMENSIYLNQQINFWENTHRFAKSLSAACLMAFLYCCASFWIQYKSLELTLIDTFEKVAKLHNNFYPTKYSLWNAHSHEILILALIPIAYLLLLSLLTRYYQYVYDNRYHRMILRSFVSIVASKNFNHEHSKENPSTYNSFNIFN